VTGMRLNKSVVLQQGAKKQLFRCFRATKASKNSTITDSLIRPVGGPCWNSSNFRSRSCTGGTQISPPITQFTEISNMKKSLLIAALIAGFAGAAQAETSVTLYGRVDGGVGYQQFKGTNPTTGESFKGSNTGMANGIM